MQGKRLVDGFGCSFFAFHLLPIGSSGVLVIRTVARFVVQNLIDLDATTQHRDHVESKTTPAPLA